MKVTTQSVRAVSQTLHEQYLELSSELAAKVDTDKTELRFGELVALAEIQGLFERTEFVLSSDSEILYEMLAFSMGLSDLWRIHKDEHPEDAKNIENVNKIFIQYMINMWGLETIQIPIQNFVREEDE